MPASLEPAPVNPRAHDLRGNAEERCGLGDRELRVEGVANQAPD